MACYYNIEGHWTSEGGSSWLVWGKCVCSVVVAMVLVDKDCKLMEANNFSRIPKLTLKVSVICLVMLCLCVGRYVSIV